jgi:cysteinyl-tRNA synthetase
LGSLEKDGFEAMDFRYFCMQANYRSHLMFSKQALDGARVSRKKLYDKVIELSGFKHDSKVQENYDKIEDYKEKFLKFINDDMNTPRCLALMWDMLKDDVLKKHEKHKLLLYFDQIFGFNLGNVKKVEVPKEIELLAVKRLEARRARDWAKSDEIRDKIRSLGWEIGDTREGYEIKKI